MQAQGVEISRQADMARAHLGRRRDEDAVEGEGEKSGEGSKNNGCVRVLSRSVEREG